MYLGGAIILNNRYDKKLFRNPVNSTIFLWNYITYFYAKKKRKITAKVFCAVCKSLYLSIHFSKTSNSDNTDL